MIGFEWLDEQDFYEVCQQYRHTPVDRPQDVIKAFEDLKAFIIEKVTVRLLEGM